MTQTHPLPRLHQIRQNQIHQKSSPTKDNCSDHHIKRQLRRLSHQEPADAITAVQFYHIILLSAGFIIRFRLLSTRLISSVSTYQSRSLSIPAIVTPAIARCRLFLVRLTSGAEPRALVPAAISTEHSQCRLSLVLSIISTEHPQHRLPSVPIILSTECPYFLAPFFRVKTRISTTTTASAAMPAKSAIFILSPVFGFGSSFSIGNSSTMNCQSSAPMRSW